MNIKLSCLLASTLSALAVTPAIAQSDAAATVNYNFIFGTGIAGSYEVMPNTLNARLQFHPGLKFDGKTETKDGFIITPNIKFGNLGAYADWFPFDGSFRLTGGLASMSRTKIEVNGSKVASQNFSVTSQSGKTVVSYAGKTYDVADGTTYRYNNTTYTISQGVLSGGANPINVSETINSATASLGVNAKVKFKSVAPYVGLGYGNPISKDGNWSFFFDFGMFLTGSPTLEVNVTSSCDSNNADSQVLCNALTEELNKQKDKTIGDTKDNLNKVKYIPSLALGVSYSF